ncbi:helix-turn-helix transcriptional regulator [Mycolicibacterium pulveris]|uniref:Transcriptional regulator n=1 Tax=Mycolicibacterium pulveris TaxID=36813 RepID=A0A7I7UFA6_MYCPV|nr:LuxR family transcriptional regulator [Mycolicibacterium pulveris]MCV6981656.1 helix-turn-helix transcriptional regulator [Mycolicibacterium pulveris]BBY79349.1 transcriptional regulator [Mycolicibacterium pulveris]
MRGGWPLIGRDEELAVVSGAIAEPAAAGILIAGSAGVGKTRLAREALAKAQRRGRRCHWLLATESARSVPLGVFAEFASGFGPDPLRRVQEIIDALVGSPSSTTSPTRPVVGIDDAHLLDEQSALVVHQLVHRRIATVVLTQRSGEQTPDAITSLWKDERLPRMDLQPLAAHEVSTLLTAVLDGEIETTSAERLWRYTHGNALYLRQLITDEIASRRLNKRAGVWVWDGQPDFSPRLLELIKANIGRHSEQVVEVLDIVALAEPVELAVLLHMASPGAVDEAQQHGLIRFDPAAQVAHLAHPMFGEARRAMAGPIGLRTLCGRLAHTIGEVCSPSLHQTVRRAVLALESDAGRDAALLHEAANAALALLDIPLAMRLGRAATESGAGRPAQFNYAVALATAARGAQAEKILGQLAASATEDAERVHIALARAANLTWVLGEPVTAERELDAAQQAAAGCGLAHAVNAVRASCHAARGQPSTAVELATEALASREVAGLPRMMGLWGLVYGLADLGCTERLSSAAHGHAFARGDARASHLRFRMGVAYVDGLCLAGHVQKARQVAAELRHDAHDVAGSRYISTLIVALAELAAGDLTAACKWLRESAALLSPELEDEPEGTFRLSEVWLSTALAMAGDAEAAEQALAGRPVAEAGGFRYWETDQALAAAWIDAARGLPSLAVRAALEAADQARALHRPTREVMCLQTATQFGDSSCADRLAELSVIVGGPRLIAVAAHSAALHAHDGTGLLEASRCYEAFGDRVAAADAAAQAAIVLREQGRRGAGLTATAVAQRLSGETGAHTYALRANRIDLPLTARQREIVTLAARGLSNRAIADRLVLSVRTVEGHLFQASQKTGVSTREELIAMVQGRSAENRPTDRLA